MKKGSIFDIFLWVIISFIVILFLGLWVWAHSILTTNLESLPTTSNGVNMSQIAYNTFGKINDAEKLWLPIIAFVIIVSEALFIWISNLFIGEHPIVFIPYIFLTAVAVIVSVYLSNIYQSLLLNNQLGATLQTFSAADYIMIYLPLWTSVIGIIGAILLTSGVISDRTRSIST